jgi:hypothetical protein
MCLLSDNRLPVADPLSTYADTQASSKGINSSNPKAGQLSAKLREERKAPLSPRQENERMMVSRSRLPLTEIPWRWEVGGAGY